jgi:hypothetical protein
MRKLFFFSMMFFICIASDAQQHGGAKMFRDNPLHFSSAISVTENIYDTKAWSFFAEAPVRSTPLINGNSVFIGSAQGKFFAINKATGKLPGTTIQALRSIHQQPARMGRSFSLTTNKPCMH